MSMFMPETPMSSCVDAFIIFISANRHYDERKRGRR